MRRPHLVLLATALATTGCIAPSVVDSAGRAVALESGPIDWRAATADDVSGLWESTSIEGDAAASVLRIWYAFARGGDYSGAALVTGENGPVFQALGGRWTLAGEVIDLGGGQEAAVWAASGCLKLATDGGIVVLARVEMR
jgi:hypothetical protein